MMNSIEENKIINSLVKNFKRSPLQINQLHSSDSELISFERCENSILTITTDSIVEEIRLGLYDDPYLIGWMIVMVNLSDLAAVGADPLGILISEIFPNNLDDTFKNKLQKGISDACNTCGTYVLGGDTNFGDQLILNGTAVGIISGGNAISRVGCKPDDILYTSGKIGSGNALALTKLVYKSEQDYKYKPMARLQEGKLIRKYASACMDTSDGVISTLDQLMRLNNFGFSFNDNWSTSLETNSKILFEKYNLPLWLLLAGQHGEFELLFTIPKSNEIDFLNSASDINWRPIQIGKVTTQCEIILPIYEKNISLDSQKIRNLANITDLNISKYLQSLLDLDESFRQNR